MKQLPAPSKQLHDLLLAQYRDSPNLIAYLNVFASEMDDAHKVFDECLNERYYYRATGAQLDVIGYIVGAGRVLEGVVVSGNFGYLQSAESLGMGREDSPLLGGVLRGENDDPTQDVILPDSRFRDWIDARIVKNHTTVNVEDTIQFFRLLLNDSDLLVNIVENPGVEAAVTITLERVLNINEVAIVVSLAQHMKPVGVNFLIQDHTGVIETLPINLKAFA